MKESAQTRSDLCPCCGEEHSTERAEAVRVFVDRYLKSGSNSLHEFAAHELIRMMKYAEVNLIPHISKPEGNSYRYVVIEGTMEIAIAAARYLDRHKQ